MFLVARTNAGDADKQYGGYLAPDKVAVMVYHPSFDATVDVCNQPTKEVQLLWLQCVGKELHQDGDVNHRPEYLVKTL